MSPEDQIIVLEDTPITAIADADITVPDELLHDDLVFTIPEWTNYFKINGH